MTLLLELIIWVNIIILFNLCTIVIFVINLNLLKKNIKSDYNHYHQLIRDSKIFFLIL